MLDFRFRNLWERLQGKKARMPQFLSEVRLDGIRGIRDLRVAFDYPVSVIAGGNASGKSTVLFACACAYKVPGAGVRDYAPSTLFPDYRPRSGERKDERHDVALDFEYVTPKGRQSMRWRRGKEWRRSFMGRKGARQPERRVYLRALGNLAKSSEDRGALGMSSLSGQPEETRLTASQIEFAQRMLPFRYNEVVKLSGGERNLLFAAQESGASYSELHMASGERAILRLSQEIAQLEGALVLVDEIESGLHPWVQQLLMLELQQLALRNDLQIIVTTHSPIVLDAVPPYGRIFLDRDRNGEVSAREAYRDVIQNALYGRSNDALNLLCEDAAAEGVLRGAFDFIAPRRNLARDSIRIGRDTGADEFPQHAAAFRKFGQIDNFVFIIDGDRRGEDIEDRIYASAGREAPIFYTPGGVAPEMWIWQRLKASPATHADGLGISPESLLDGLDKLDSIYDSASDAPSRIVKAKLRNLADDLGWSVPDICRMAARREADDKASAIRPLIDGLESALLEWRERRDRF